MFKQLLTRSIPRNSFSRSGFVALKSSQVQQSVVKHQNQKLDTLVDVLLSLNNKQLSYLNQIQSQHSLLSGNSILQNKIYSVSGIQHTPLQFIYQNNWIKKNWKQTHLLTTILISQDQQDNAKDQQQVVKQIWQIQLTSVDASQKIKIIKVLREMFSLGLKQAKEIADKTPSIIKRQRKQEAEKIKETLEKQGCVITLK